MVQLGRCRVCRSRRHRICGLRVACPSRNAEGRRVRQSQPPLSSVSHVSVGDALKQAAHSKEVSGRMQLTLFTVVSMLRLQRGCTTLVGNRHKIERVQNEFGPIHEASGHPRSCRDRPGFCRSHANITPKPVNISRTIPNWVEASPYVAKATTTHAQRPRFAEIPTNMSGPTPN